MTSLLENFSYMIGLVRYGVTYMVFMHISMTYLTHLYVISFLNQIHVYASTFPWYVRPAQV